MSTVGRPRLQRLGKALKTTRQQRESLRCDHATLNSVLPTSEPVAVRVADALFGSWDKAARTLVMATGLSILLTFTPIDFTMGPVTITHLETCQIDQPPTNVVMADNTTLPGADSSETARHDPLYGPIRAS